MFLCFIKDLPESIRPSQTKLFADDSLLYKVSESDSDRALLQRDLSALEQWEQTWQMSFNRTKCIVMRISTKKNKKVLHTQYQIHGHTLDVVNIDKYLGMTIKDDLSCDAHIQNTVTKANRTVGFLRRNLKECKLPVNDIAYKTMVHQFWSMHHQSGTLYSGQYQVLGAGATSSCAFCLQRLPIQNSRVRHQDARRPQVGTS